MPERARRTDGRTELLYQNRCADARLKQSLQKVKFGSDGFHDNRNRTCYF